MAKVGSATAKGRIFLFRLAVKRRERSSVDGGHRLSGRPLEVEASEAVCFELPIELPGRQDARCPHAKQPLSHRDAGQRSNAKPATRKVRPGRTAQDSVSPGSVKARQIERLGHRQDRKLDAVLEGIAGEPDGAVANHHEAMPKPRAKHPQPAAFRVINEDDQYQPRRERADHGRICLARRSDRKQVRLARRLIRPRLLVERSGCGANLVRPWRTRTARCCGRRLPVRRRGVRMR
jgi:hypothetical protein